MSSKFDRLMLVIMVSFMAGCSITSLALAALLINFVLQSYGILPR